MCPGNRSRECPRGWTARAQRNPSCLSPIGARCNASGRLGASRWWPRHRPDDSPELLTPADRWLVGGRAQARQQQHLSRRQLLGQRVLGEPDVLAGARQCPQRECRPRRLPHRPRLDRVVHFLTVLDQNRRGRHQVLSGDKQALRQWEATRRRAATSTTVDSSCRSTRRPLRTTQTQLAPHRQLYPVLQQAAWWRQGHGRGARHGSNPQKESQWVRKIGDRPNVLDGP